MKLRLLWETLQQKLVTPAGAVARGLLSQTKKTGHTGDLLASIHGTFALLKHMDEMNSGKGLKPKDFKKGHPDLSAQE